MPKVSVVIPTHNQAKLLPLAVGTVLEQTFPNFEIIIVDDASTDNTKEMVQGFKDTRIKFLHRDIRGGDAVARNLGILNSKGEYIAVMDDDDEWAPEKLEQKRTSQLEGSCVLQIFKFQVDGSVCLTTEGFGASQG